MTRVGYNRVVAGVLLVLGLAALALNGWVVLLGGRVGLGAIGNVVSAVIGALMLVRPYFEVREGEVVVPAVIGPMRRRYPYRSLALEGGRFFAVAEDGGRRKLPPVRWLARGADWDAVSAS